MIVDTLSNRALYQGLHPRLHQALEHLATTDFSLLQPGNYELDGKNLFVIVNDYQTQAPGTEPFETHKRYVDVQFVVSGEEAFGYLPLAEQAPLAPYHEKHDYTEYAWEDSRADASFVTLKAGMFAIFFPGDMHMPGTGNGTPVRKVVIKVLW